MFVRTGTGLGSGRLGKGESKGEALRDAQRELIKEGVKPYYWASFELVGDPNGTI